ncbi:MAG: hypothetical protein QOG63_1899 [Thermoleophilaceae bacterium]|jgi:hypothetical protein|nr:hypothetical protein [Thermoleophilaceae bacterium]
MASSEPPQHVPHRGDKVWQEEQRDLADRNAAAQREGKKQREEHEQHVAKMRRDAEAEMPDGRWR